MANPAFNRAIKAPRTRAESFADAVFGAHIADPHHFLGVTRKAALAIEALMQSRRKWDGVLEQGHRVDYDKRDGAGLSFSGRLTHAHQGAGGEWLWW